MQDSQKKREAPEARPPPAKSGRANPKATVATLWEAAQKITTKIFEPRFEKDSFSMRPDILEKTDFSFPFILRSEVDTLMKLAPAVVAAATSYFDTKLKHSPDS